MPTSTTPVATASPTSAAVGRRLYFGFNCAVMPSLATRTSNGTALAPCVAYVIDSALSSALLKPLTVPIFGFFAPARIDMPRPDRARNVRESAASFPALISSSTSVVVMITRSNGSPASTRFLSCVDGSNWMLILSPDDCSNLGMSSSTTALTPLVQSTLISAAEADVEKKVLCTNG